DVPSSGLCTAAPGAPTAIIAVTTPPQQGIGGAIEGLLGMNDWESAETVGGILLSAGYNVFTSYVTASGTNAITSVIALGDHSTANDLFWFNGHGSDGTIALPLGGTGPNADETFSYGPEA